MQGVKMASDVCRSEDLVRALMEYLVDPRLPFRFSANDTPDLSVQQAVAKQMYAVVLLYNYYHRKQHPELEFLDVVAFCKLSLILRPTMIAFMKFMNQGDPKELNGIKDGLSVTEKAIRDACDISSALDTSKDVPNTEGWPISKVAVLLIDSKNENCLLQFGSVTEGVWTLIEKELDESNISSKFSAEKKVGNKRKRNSRKSIDEKNADDNGFLQLAFDAVKEVTGINSSDLVVLETHRVYSLSKEKTAALFYMMQCGSISESEGIPVEDVVNILQGPLVEKTCGSWTITPVVEYYHMHPYAGIISHWFLRKCSSMPSLDGINSQSTKEITESIARNLLELKGLEKDLDHVDMHCQTIDNSCGRVANENSDSNNKKYKHSSSGKEASPVNISRGTGKDDNGTDKCNKIYENINSAKKEADSIHPEVLNQNGGKEWPKGSPSRPSGEPQRIDMDAFPKTYLSNEDAKKNQISKIKVYRKKKNSPSMQINAYAPISGVNVKAEMVDSLMSNGIQEKDGKVCVENCYITTSSNQNGIPLANAEQVPLEPNNECIEEVKITSASEALQNALILLYRRRQELYSQICSMGDELALHEGNIERIRDGGEMRLSGTFLPGNSSCQDLESVCLKNNWRLPRYYVETSSGKFKSEVVLRWKDSTLSLMSDLKSHPHEARESAAARMIAKLRTDLLGFRSYINSS